MVTFSPEYQSAVSLEQVEHLKAQLKNKEAELEGQLAMRLHRAISWLQSAQEAQSVDIEFISLWIAFSSCCSIDTQGDHPLGHHDQFVCFVEQLVGLDSEKKIYRCLWQEYSGHVKALIRNPYVFHAFWQSQRQGNEHWKTEFDQSSLQALNALSRQRVAELASIVLDRLFVLRNQMIYGGATFKSRVNREQVCDGAGLLGTLMPTVIELMLSAPKENWGEVTYPVVRNT